MLSSLFLENWMAGQLTFFLIISSWFYLLFFSSSTLASSFLRFSSSYFFFSAACLKKISLSFFLFSISAFLSLAAFHISSIFLVYSGDSGDVLLISIASLDSLSTSYFYSIAFTAYFFRLTSFSASPFSLNFAFRNWRSYSSLA